MKNYRYSARPIGERLWEHIPFRGKKPGKLRESGGQGVRLIITTRVCYKIINFFKKKPIPLIIPLHVRNSIFWGKMISDGTYYLSCWMTMAQIEEIKSRKVIFQNLD
jgi:hypothetical protein